MDHDSLHTVLESLRDRIDEAAYDDGIDARRAGIEDAICEIEGYLRSGESSELYYLLGYASYMHPDWMSSPDLQTRVERALRRVLQLVPDDPYAWMYLGYNSYDLRHYEEALARFGSIDGSALPPRLKTKAREMLVCCHLRLSNIDSCVVELGRLVEAYDTHPAELIDPINLRCVVREISSTGHSAELASLRPLLLRLDHLADSVWFGDLVRAC